MSMRALHGDADSFLQSFSNLHTCPSPARQHSGYPCQNGTYRVMMELRYIPIYKHSPPIYSVKFRGYQESPGYNGTPATHPSDYDMRFCSGLGTIELSIVRQLISLHRASRLPYFSIPFLLRPPNFNSGTSASFI